MRRLLLRLLAGFVVLCTLLLALFAATIPTIRKRWRRRLTAALLLSALFAVWAAGPTHAAETRGGDNVVVGRDEVVEGDLYVSATTVTVDGIIKGDLVGAASRITVNGTVEGDILAAAQDVVINGVVGDDARAFAQVVQVGPQAQIRGDLAVGVLSLESQAGSVITGDVLVGGYQALLAGAVGHNILGGLNRMELRGTTSGSVDVAVSGDQNVSAVQFSPTGQVAIPSVPVGLTIADSARIEGKLTYRAPREATLNPGAQIVGGSTFEQFADPVNNVQPAPAQGLRSLKQFAGLLLAGLLLLWLVPTWIHGMTDTVTTKPLPSMAWGLVAFVAVIVAVLIIVVTTGVLALLLGLLTLGSVVAWVIGFGLLASGALVFGYATFTTYIAVAIVAPVAGRWLLHYVRPAWAESAYLPLVVGLVLYVLLKAVPWLGTVINILVVLLALGALWQWGRAQIQRGTPVAQPVSGLQPA